MSLFNKTLYLSSKTKPVARVADDGVFVLTLLAYNPIRAGVRDAWRLLWAGVAAQAWHHAHGADLVPGAELLVEADTDKLRPFDTRGRASGAEMHATISAITVTHVPGKPYTAQQCAIHCDFAAY